ncbi:DUF423 domain-containing protein [Gaetbulibacter saemankumensis]|uniref:DUF423 domain-containing protein n=1 Tax=Gaetbulibacter saemankumensis TaxID=311208 RepID=UPI000412485A|nr:DUF423 domain-containing protein [Gaetbulibacter saemankumensis]
MNRTVLLAGGVLGALSIILGAFGAHALKALISLEAQQTFETGVRYQMYHAILLLFVGYVPFLTDKLKNTLFYLIMLGVVFFSGSIYFLATNELTNFDFKTIGFITPIGGLLLIGSWGLLVVNFLRIKS